MTKERKKYGVYQHATWGYSMIEGEWKEGVKPNPDGGYVVREVSPAVPYGRMTPLKVFARKADAEKFADRVTMGGVWI